MTLDIQPIKEEVQEFLYNSQELSIATADDYSKAGDTLKLVNHKIKTVEAKRVEYTKPLLDQKRLIDSDFKAVIEPLKAFVTEVKGKMVEWAREEQKRKDAEQARIEEEAKKANPETLEVEVPVVNDMKTTRGEVSTTSIKKVWKFEVMDETMVPAEFMMVDEAKIKQAIKEGNHFIKGVKIYQDDQISIR